MSSLRNLLERLGDQIDFYVVTRDRDLGDTEPYSNVSTMDWVPVTGGQVLYLAPGEATIGACRSLITEVVPEKIYLNSTLSRQFSLFPLLASYMSKSKPHVVLAPRGEFSPGALGLKRLQKKAYLSVLRLCGAWRNVEWQASSVFEAADIRTIAGATARITVAPDLPGILPPLPAHEQKRSGHAEIVFLGRISPMKNLDGAIAMLFGVAGTVDFRIYGPIEDQPHWHKCLELAQSLPASVRFHYEGNVAPKAVHSILAAADALLLPSHGENFGHVVAEALAAGCPVILSDRTPWRNLQHYGVGWDLPLERPEGLTSAIQQIIDMGENNHASYRARARGHAEDLAGDATLLQSNRDLLIVPRIVV